MFDATLRTFALVNTLNYSINIFLSVVKILRFPGDRIYIFSKWTPYVFCMKPNPASWLIDKFVTFSLILLNCQQQSSIYWPYSQVDIYIWDRCHITSSLYNTDTSLRWTVAAGSECVRLREVWLYFNRMKKESLTEPLYCADYFYKKKANNGTSWRK